MQNQENYQKLRGCQNLSTIAEDYVDPSMNPAINRLDADAIDSLKQKVIKDYKWFLHRLERGYKESRELILDEISFLDVFPLLDNQKQLHQFYMNKNVWK